MAAPNPAAPAGSIKNFFQFTQDEANDPTRGSIDFTWLEVDPNDRGNATSPAAIKQRLNTLTSHGAVAPIGMIGPQAVLSLYFAGQIALPSIRGRQSAREGEFIGLLGDVDASGNFYEYQFGSAPFELARHNVVCASANTLKTSAQAHVAGAGVFEVGPYTAGDADTDSVATRRFFVVPFFLVPLFLAIGPDQDVVLEFWKSIYPVIETKGKLTECAALIKYFRVAATKRDATETTRQTELTDNEHPTSVGRDDSVRDYVHHGLMQRYPAIFQPAAPAAVNAGQNRVADALDRQNEIQEQALEANLESQQKKEVNQILKAVGGNNSQLQYILNMFSAQTVDDLPTPMQQLLKATSKTAMDNIIIDKMRALVLQKPEYGSVPNIPAGTGDRIIKQFWHMRSSNEPSTGAALCNLFLLHGQKAEIEAEREELQLNEQANIAVDKEEQRALERSKVYLTTTDGAPGLVRKALILWLAITDEDDTHDVVKWLKQYWVTLTASLESIKEFPRRNDYPKSLIGVHIQATVSRELQRYSEAILRNGAFTGTLNDQLIVDVVAADDGLRHWETISNTIPKLQRLYPQTFTALQGSGNPSGLPTDEITLVGGAAHNFGRLSVVAGSVAGGGASHGVWQDDVSQIGGDLTERSRPVAVVASNRPASASVSARPAPVVATSRTNQERGTKVYNRNPYQALRNLWQDKRAKCGSTKKAVREGQLPALPSSKVAGHENDPMCLNWHVSESCLDNCREKYDHVPYDEAELNELKEWVSTNATRREEDDRPRNRRGGRGRGRGNNE